MEVFTVYFSWLFDLLDFCCVYIGGYRFSLGGAIVFAVIVIVFLAFLRWLFGGD